MEPPSFQLASLQSGVHDQPPFPQPREYTPSPGHTSPGNHVTFQFPRLSPGGSTPSRWGLFNTNKCDHGDVHTWTTATIQRPAQPSSSTNASLVCTNPFRAHSHSTSTGNLPTPAAQAWSPHHSGSRLSAAYHDERNNRGSSESSFTRTLVLPSALSTVSVTMPVSPLR